MCAASTVGRDGGLAGHLRHFLRAAAIYYEREMTDGRFLSEETDDRKSGTIGSLDSEERR